MNTRVKVLFVSLLAISVAGVAFGQEKTKDQKPATANLQVTQCALKVSGMTCGGCADIVKERLVKLEGVKTASVDYKTGDVQVEYDAKKTTPEKIVATFNEGSGGFKAQLAKPKAKSS